MEISNKVALITGGASGLGLATAEVLVESGSKVMLLDLNEDNAKSAVEKLGTNSSYVIANVTDESSVQTAIDKTVEEIIKFKPVNQFKLMFDKISKNYQKKKFKKMNYSFIKNQTILLNKLNK